MEPSGALCGKLNTCVVVGFIAHGSTGKPALVINLASGSLISALTVLM
jgi:hypothetical protein